jgi:hypothetical protein
VYVGVKCQLISTTTITTTVVAVIIIIIIINAMSRLKQSGPVNIKSLEALSALFSLESPLSLSSSIPGRIAAETAQKDVMKTSVSLQLAAEIATIGKLSLFNSMLEK